MKTRSECPACAAHGLEMNRTTVFYDGSCPLCQAEAGLYRNRDSNEKQRLVDVSVLDADLPMKLDPISATTRFHVMSHVDHFLSGAAAFADVWNQIPVWRLAARIAAWPEKDIRRN